MQHIDENVARSSSGVGSCDCIARKRAAGRRSGDLHQTESQAGRRRSFLAPLPQQLEAGVAEIARHAAAPLTDLVPHAGNRSVKDKVLRSFK